MALINCPECGGQVSTQADACPHCGYRPTNADTSATSDSHAGSDNEPEAPEPQSAADAPDSGDVVKDFLARFGLARLRVWLLGLALYYAVNQLYWIATRPFNIDLPNWLGISLNLALFGGAVYAGRHLVDLLGERLGDDGWLKRIAYWALFILPFAAAIGLLILNMRLHNARADEQERVERTESDARNGAASAASHLSKRANLLAERAHHRSSFHTALGNEDWATSNDHLQELRTLEAPLPAKAPLVQLRFGLAAAQDALDEAEKAGDRDDYVTALAHLRTAMRHIDSIDAPEVADSKEVSELRSSLEALQTRYAGRATRKLERDIRRMPQRKPTVWSVTLSDIDVDLSSRWAFDRYYSPVSEYSLHRADKDERYLVVDFKATSEDKNPMLPGFAVYLLKPDKAHRIATARLKFYSWSSYGAYLGNHHDSKNDFSKSETIRFTAGMAISEDAADSPLLVAVSPSGCYRRKRVDIGHPPVKYVGRNCGFPSTVRLADVPSEIKAVELLNSRELEVSAEAFEETTTAFDDF